MDEKKSLFLRLLDLLKLDDPEVVEDGFEDGLEVAYDDSEAVDGGIDLTNGPRTKQENQRKPFFFHDEHRYNWHIFKILPLLWLVVVLWLTMQHIRLDLLICAYILFMASFVVLNTFNVFDNLLAPQSRYIIAINLVLLIVTILLKDIYFMPVTLVFAILAIFIIKKLNRSWVSDRNYFYTKYVEKGLNHELDNIVVRHWQAQGKRETKTLLNLLGLNDVDVDIVAKPIYISAYAAGIEKISSDTLKELETVKKELQKSKNQLAKESKQQSERLAELESELTSSNNAYKFLQGQYKTLLHEKEMLIQANNELVEKIELNHDPGEQAAQEEKEVAAEQPEEKPTEERVRELKAAGKSERAIGEILGISRSKVRTCLGK